MKTEILSKLFFVLSMSASIFGNSQTINYADSVISFSTEYSDPDWAAWQALLYPDTYPTYGDIETAWASASADGQREFLELHFGNAMPIDSIWVYETLAGGAIDTIYVRNPTTMLWEIVYSGAITGPIGTAQIFKVGFPMTAFDVSDVRIAVNSPAVASWNEIDAVAIVNSTPTEVIVCPGDSILLSGIYYSTAGIYPDSIYADSDIEMITLVEGVASASSIVATACLEYVSPSGLYTWTVSGFHNDTISNAMGCDSVITVDLTINSPDINVTVVASDTLKADASGAGITYQWIDCSDSSIIAGATSQAFAPTTSGDYAVIVDDNGCIDTSACTNISGVGMDTNAAAELKIYPNPSNGKISVVYQTVEKIQIEIISMLGERISIFQSNATTSIIDLSDMESGYYFVRVISSETSLTKKIQLL